MDQTRITQCPKCDTTFRITPAQLKVANGAVRCGACLNVFRAAEHFQAAAEEAPIKQDDRTQDLFSDSKGLADKINDEPITNEYAIQDDDDDGGLIDDSGYIGKFSLESNEQSQSTKESQSFKTDFSDIIDDSGHIDDDFLIDDDNGLIEDEKAPPKAVEFNEDFLSLDTEDKSGAFHSSKNDLESTVKESESEDESWAHALLDDSEDFEPTQQPKSAPEPEAPKKKVKPAKKDIFPNQTIGASFDQFEAAPLDLSLPGQKRRHKAVLTGLACIVMIFTLVAQAAYFNFDQWARQDNYRSWYKVACQTLDCTLPSSYDLARIRTTASPQVSSHPKFKNALMIDVLFMNSAEFTQAFPKIELTFSNAAGKVIAHRLFSPDEYLAGEASGLTMMPIRTPIHIALEISDPGKNANNYQVRFLAP